MARAEGRARGLAAAVLILGIESATARVGCAVGDRSGVRAVVQTTRARHHAELLAPQIQTACSQAGVSLQDVEAVAVDIGPGLYTGLRVGVTTAVAMAHALRAPMVGLTSLDVVAFGLRHTRRRIAAVIDARRREVFWACYRSTGTGVRRLGDPAVDSPEQAASLIASASAASDADASDAETGAAGSAVESGASASTGAAGAVGSTGGVLVAGDGAAAYASVFAGVRGAELADGGFAHPSAESLVLLAQEAAQRRELARPYQIAPLYLRRPDAKARWAA